MSKFNLRGKLTLTIHKARNLANRILVGQMDPYAEIRLSNNNEKFKTKVAKDQHSNPVWEQMYIFNLEGKEELLHVNVLHEGAMSDDHIGRADISLDLLDLSGSKRWYQLKDKSNFSKQTGEIELTMIWEGIGLPEDSQSFKTHHARKAGSTTPTQQQAASAPVTTMQAPVVQQQLQQPQQQQQYGSQPNYNQAPPQQQYSQPPQQQYQQPPQQQYQQPPPQQYQQPPPQQYQSQQPMYQAPPQPVYQAPPQPVYASQAPVYAAPQPVIYASQAPPVVIQQPVYQPPQVVFQQAPAPQIVYQSQPQTVVYTQSSGQIIGYWPNGQPRYAGQ